ncbi:type VII secretion protein EssC, partial [Streptococcus oricebi]|nr:type VII secretion protein EssC [Streptococcus oricebi]
MTQTIVLYRESLRYELELLPDKDYLLASHERAQLFLPDLPAELSLSLRENQVYYELEGESGILQNGQVLLATRFFLLDKESQIYDLLDKQELVLGSHEGSAFYTPDSPCHLLLKKEGQAWQLTLLAGQVYLNNALLRQDSLTLQVGDELAFEDKIFKFYPDEVRVQGPVQVTASLAPRSRSRYDFYEEYPDFHRSPRIIYRGSEDKISINTPSNEPNKPTDELLKLVIPPLLMVGVTILIALVQPRGIYILLTMVMSLASIFFSVTTFFKNRKKYKQDLKERKFLYRAYLKDKAIELSQMARDQKEGQLYHYPDLGTLERLTKDYSHRIYEKTPLHFDFLYYRLGLGKVPTSYSLSYSKTERSGQKDPLEEEGYALYEGHRKIEGMPVVANLAHGPVGYIGPRPLVIEQLQLLVTQLSVFHSYHDVQFITIMPEEERSDWEWMRWLPHSSLQDMNVRGFVYNQRTHDQVLNSLNQILKLRKAQLDEKGAGSESTIFSPHYVVLITDEKLILDHVIMEFFTEDPTELGCSLIFVQDVLSSLSENIKTIINIKDRNQGQLVMEEGVLREHDFALDHFPAGYDKEGIARRLAPLNHLQNLKSSIPDTVTFMEMYEAESFADLHVPERWAKNAPYKSLSVPVGLRGKEDLVHLNLHEKAHGPHGLVAGTTGSGKSEMIQSY